MDEYASTKAQTREEKIAMFEATTDKVIVEDMIYTTLPAGGIQSKEEIMGVYNQLLDRYNEKIVAVNTPLVLLDGEACGSPIVLTMKSRRFEKVQDLFDMIETMPRIWIYTIMLKKCIVVEPGTINLIIQDINFIRYGELADLVETEEPTDNGVRILYAPQHDLKTTRIIVCLGDKMIERYALNKERCKVAFEMEKEILSPDFVEKDNE